MIVRVMQEAQYEIDASLEDDLFRLDVALDAALASGDEEKYRAALAAILAVVRGDGQALDSEKLVPADLVVPDPSLSLQEVRQRLESEAFEC
jgi:hypothetical protein